MSFILSVAFALFGAIWAVIIPYKISKNISENFKYEYSGVIEFFVFQILIRC